MKIDLKIFKSSETLSAEISIPFVQGMLDRMIVSYYKYGAIKASFPSHISALDSIQLRLDKYKDTGNTEYLIDVANFAMIEFIHPSIVGAEYKPTDSDGSPGRITKHGLVTHESNNSAIEKLYKRDGD